MNRYCLISFALTWLLSAQLADAHGFKVSVDANNKLQLVSEDPTAGGNDVYKVQSLFGPVNARENDHPGYEAVGGFGNGDELTFDLLGPLWYSTGAGPAVLAPANVGLTISAQDFITYPGQKTADAASGFQTGIPFAEYDGVGLGDFEHQLRYLLTHPASVPAGAYAISLRLNGTRGSNAPFVPSDPFVAIFNNGLTLTTFNNAAGPLFAAAVPEPSSIVMALMAGVGMLVVGCRQRWSRKSCALNTTRV